LEQVQFRIPKAPDKFVGRFLDRYKRISKKIPNDLEIAYITNGASIIG